MKKLEKHIGYWLRIVSNQVSNTFAKALASSAISVAEWVVLNLLEERTLSPAEISEKIGITRGATSKVLDKLLSKGLIHRKESIKDRRYQEVQLARKGEKILPQLRKVADDNDEHFFAHLSKDEEKIMMSILAKIIAKNKLEQIPLD